MDMRFYWIQDRIKQQQFRVHWKPGKENRGDYHAKHHAPSHHRNVRPLHLSTFHEQ